MANHQEARVKLPNTRLNKLKFAAKNKTGTILRLNKKNVEDEELPHELFLTTRQATKIRNAFAISKTQIFKVTQSGGSFGFWLANLGKKRTNKFCYSFARDNFS